MHGFGGVRRDQVTPPGAGANSVQSIRLDPFGFRVSQVTPVVVLTGPFVQSRRLDEFLFRFDQVTPVDAPVVEPDIDYGGGGRGDPWAKEFDRLEAQRLQDWQDMKDWEDFQAFIMASGVFNKH